MSGETTQRSGFDMKSAQLPVVAFALRSPDTQQLAQEFAERFGSDSTFFDNDPVLIDLALLREADEAIDFPALIALLRQYRTTPVAVRGGSAAQMAQAHAAGLVAAPEAPPARRQEAKEPEVREVVREVEVVKEVQLPAKPTLLVEKPMRSGQQVYAAGGDVVVNAIVSFGAEVIADGNVHDMEARLRSLCPALTERERAVCIRLLQGMTQDGIASDLGLALPTVKTYRNRAFARLGIHFRNELFARVLSG